LEGQVQILDWTLPVKPFQEVLKGQEVKYGLRIIVRNWKLLFQVITKKTMPL